MRQYGLMANINFSRALVLHILEWLSNHNTMLDYEFHIRRPCKTNEIRLVIPLQEQSGLFKLLVSRILRF